MPPRPRINPLSAPRHAGVLSSVASSRLSSAPRTVKTTPSIPSHARRFSSTSSHKSDSSSPKEPSPPPPSRWISDLQARLGKCIIFGCDATQIQRAAGVLGVVAREWRALSAGAEGFVTGRRRGLEGQRVVWGEMDSFGHVNNAHYLRYAESSRVNWVMHFAAQDAVNRTAWSELMQPTGTGLIMKTIKADYKFPMTYPDTISVYHKLRSPPSDSDTSLVLDCVILSHRHRRVAARTEEDVVVYDYRQGRKTAVPEFALDMFQRTCSLQEERVRWARERIWGLVREVEGLERETWDREGAVEDHGGGKR